MHVGIGSALERAAIVGTAPSWGQTPWHDPTLTVISLNDAYLIKGFARADEWVDMHPMDKFWFTPEPPPGQKAVVYAHTIPQGHYVRPSHHLDWLATQTMPIWLHPDHERQLPASADWPNARRFPKAEIEAHFGRYFTSTPAWMLAHIILRGAREIHIYGIHLSTEAEYIDQRPNFEFLIGAVLGRGKRRITIADGLRHYESPDGHVVLPEASPVLDAKFQYAFDPMPSKKLDPLKWDLHKATVKRERTVEALKKASWFTPWTVVATPDDAGVIHQRRVTVSTLQQELWYYEAMVADCQDALARASAGA